LELDDEFELGLGRTQRKLIEVSGEIPLYEGRKDERRWDMIGCGNGKD
jgi:hypothetical protein